MDEAEYPGIRISLTAHFDGTRTPLKVDISTGDIITPQEVRYPFKLMLEDRSIELWAYNIETVLAEKLETIISRATANTRMRDFYDIAILTELYADEINPTDLHDALDATAHKRGTEKHLDQAREVLEEVENSQVMQHLWDSYRQKFSYASRLKWPTIMEAVSKLYSICENATAFVQPVARRGVHYDLQPDNFLFRKKCQKKSARKRCRKESRIKGTRVPQAHFICYEARHLV